MLIVKYRKTNDQKASPKTRKQQDEREAKSGDHHSRGRISPKSVNTKL